MWKIIFTTPMSSSKPTPTPTVAMRRVPFITAFTCSASTDKSGSAMVMRSPMKKPTDIKTPILLEAVRPWPMYWPMGVMAISAPRLKRPIPSTSRRADAKKTSSSRTEMLTQGVRERPSTNRLTGITERRDSRSFSRKEATMADWNWGEGFSITYKDTNIS